MLSTQQRKAVHQNKCILLLASLNKALLSSFSCSEHHLIGFNSFVALIWRPLLQLLAISLACHVRCEVSNMHEFDARFVLFWCEVCKMRWSLYELAWSSYEVKTKFVRTRWDEVCMMSTQRSYEDVTLKDCLKTVSKLAPAQWGVKVLYMQISLQCEWKIGYYHEL